MGTPEQEASSVRACTCRATAIVAAVGLLLILALPWCHPSWRWAIDEWWSWWGQKTQSVLALGGAIIFAVAAFLPARYPGGVLAISGAVLLAFSGSFDFSKVSGAVEVEDFDALALLAMVLIAAGLRAARIGPSGRLGVVIGAFGGSVILLLGAMGLLFRWMDPEFRGFGLGCRCFDVMPQVWAAGLQAAALGSIALACLWPIGVFLLSPGNSKALLIGEIAAKTTPFIVVACTVIEAVAAGLHDHSLYSTPIRFPLTVLISEVPKVCYWFAFADGLGDVMRWGGSRRADAT